MLVSWRLPCLPLGEPWSKQALRRGRLGEQERACLVKKPVDVAEHGLRADRAQPVNGVRNGDDVIVAQLKGPVPRLVVEIELPVGARYFRMPVVPATDRQQERVTIDEVDLRVRKVTPNGAPQ